MLAIEYYTNTSFPTKDLEIAQVTELKIGEEHVFSYLHELELVGTYRYIVTQKQQDLYTLVSNTDISTNEGVIKLDSIFFFDDHYKPAEYILKVNQNSDSSIINVTFTGNNVISVVKFANETVTLSEEFPEKAYFSENNMPGFWEIFLLSAELEIGTRYTAQVYIPQGGGFFNLEFYVQTRPQTITYRGQQISCVVVQENTLDLRFYFYEGEMIQMINEDQDITFIKTSN
jgi:hypothetical protein